MSKILFAYSLFCSALFILVLLYCAVAGASLAGPATVFLLEPFSGVPCLLLAYLFRKNKLVKLWIAIVPVALLTVLPTVAVYFAVTGLSPLAYDPVNYMMTITSLVFVSISLVVLIVATKMSKRSGDESGGRIS
jgi:hypothetical protein